LTPNFLYAALETPTCAPFFEERRMNFATPPHFTGNREMGHRQALLFTR
jgi:hypothetical protein